METLSKLKPFKHNDRTYVWMEEVHNFLKSVKIESSKPSKVETHINSYKASERIVKIDEKCAIPLVSLLKFVFNKMDTMHCCREFATAIETFMADNIWKESEQPAEDTTMIFNLYLIIANSKIGDGMIGFLSDEHFNKFKPPFLTECHREYFMSKDNKGWKKIQLFEWHFGLGWQKKTCTHAQMNKAKWGFWDSYTKMSNLTENIKSDISIVKRRREKRKQLATASKKVFVQATRKHLPCKIESELFETLNRLISDVHCIVIVDTEDSAHSNNLLAYVEFKSNKVHPMATKIIQRILTNKHQCGVTICYVLKGTLDAFKTNGQIARFKLRDEMLMGMHQEHIIQTDFPQTAIAIELCDENDDGTICENCFTTNDHLQPLDYENFEIFSEWLFDVPLLVQLVFYQFINARSTEKTGNAQGMLNKKCNYFTRHMMSYCIHMTRTTLGYYKWRTQVSS